MVEAINACQGKKRTPLHRAGQSLPLNPKSVCKVASQSEKKSKHRYICCRKGCNHKTSNSKFKFHKIPKFPAPTRSAKPDRRSVKNRAARLFQRRELLRRCGQDANCTKDYWICEDHKFRFESKSIKVTYTNGTSDIVRYRMQLFEDIGVSSTLNKSTTSLGLGCDRELKRVCELSKKVIAGGFKSPEEVNEAEKKVEEVSKKLSSRCSPTRSSVEAERDMLREKVMLLEETIAAIVEGISGAVQLGSHSNC